ncbi:hypothetical protein [Bradyrhizobium cosmicum]|uniref:hypothetical protein n=1 Tax=Bradyrhizobium cosmicum TaxID=1404864 RepID=UPI0011647344|nr:hypothetical protein [Bradyrhizobium cosmicum]QDP26092.1 hypothetical protein FNV92_29715 [Bradyrhizobium cosmicum]
MVAGSNPARGAKFINKLNDLMLRPDVARDAVRVIVQDDPRSSPLQNRVQADVCGSATAVIRAAPNRLNSNRALPGRTLTELIPMPDIQIDRPHLAPSILPADLPELSDDECIACLARAVETPDSARLDEVAALIGRLAVTIE